MKPIKSLATLAVAGAGLALSTVAISGTASALSNPVLPDYGFDGTAHIIVSGGSDTTYRAMTSIADLYNISSIAGCTAQTSATSPTQSTQLNQCLSTDATPSLPLANYDRDTVVNAAPTGSGAGIASLNGYTSAGGSGTYTYEGANGAVNFARSSRAPNTTGGSCAGGNELTCDTFWGFAEDGVKVFGFGTHGGINLTASQIYQIYSCQLTTWGQVTGTASDTQPIVPWGMNSASGTYATFNNYLVTSGGAPTGFTVNSSISGAGTTYPSASGKCVRPLSSGVAPFENDVKPLFSDVDNNQGGITSGGVNDPNNWLWFGSYGLLAAFPYDNTYTDNAGAAFTAASDPIANASGTYVTPGPSTILSQNYPIDRTLYHVTLKSQADCPAANGTCDFTDNPGDPIGTSGATDLNVKGPNGGIGGAVREFTRFLCRSSATQDPVDPYSGANLYTEVQAARAASGFTPVPTALKTPGSSCQVQTSG